MVQSTPPGGERYPISLLLLLLSDPIRSDVLIKSQKDDCNGGGLLRSSRIPEGKIKDCSEQIEREHHRNPRDPQAFQRLIDRVPEDPKGF